MNVELVGERRTMTGTGGEKLTVQKRLPWVAPVISDTDVNLLTEGGIVPKGSEPFPIPIRGKGTPTIS